jgi:hypothetical protein
LSIERLLTIEAWGVHALPAKILLAKSSAVACLAASGRVLAESFSLIKGTTSVGAKA